MPSSVATASAHAPRLLVQTSGNFGFVIRQPTWVCHSLASVGNGTSGFGSTNGARLMLSTPPATIRSASPEATARAAMVIASPPDAQSRLTVTPGTVDGKPGEQGRHPSHVAVVLTRAVGVAEDDVVDAALVG